jgi:hypothetical protein
MRSQPTTVVKVLSQQRATSQRSWCRWMMVMADGSDGWMVVAADAGEKIFRSTRKKIKSWVIAMTSLWGRGHMHSCTVQLRTVPFYRFIAHTLRHQSKSTEISSEISRSVFGHDQTLCKLHKHT